jgi:hypothetical protein
MREYELLISSGGATMHALEVTGSGAGGHGWAACPDDQAARHQDHRA